MRAALGFALSLVLVGCGGGLPSPAPSPSSPEEAAPEETSLKAETRDVSQARIAAEAERRVAEALAKVARVRGLAIKAEVASKVLERPELLDRVREHVASEVPPEVIRGQGELLFALGLVPADFEYEQAVFRLLEAQLAGFYEPHEKAMYLAGDLASEAANATLAHELVHALQDQHWDLAPRLAYKPGGSDEQSAVHALAEGDATSAMMDVLLADRGASAINMPETVFSLEVEMSMAAAGGGAEIPRALRASLAAPYVDGLKFVHALRRRGGWAAVNEAWRSPPTTTEQLLHLDKYDRREAPMVLPAAVAPPGEGWAVAHEEILGEQGLRIVLEEWAPKRVAGVAAAGWGGDRATLFRRGPDESPSFALLWHLRFDAGPKGDADREAREAFDVLAKMIETPARKSALCVMAEGLGPRAIVRVGRDVVVAAGPYRRANGHTGPQGECAETQRWASRVAAQTMR